MQENVQVTYLQSNDKSINNPTSSFKKKHSILQKEKQQKYFFESFTRILCLFNYFFF